MENAFGHGVVELEPARTHACPPYSTTAEIFRGRGGRRQERCDQPAACVVSLGSGEWESSGGAAAGSASPSARRSSAGETGFVR